LLDEGGPAALSLREVARRAGCTHQAPYHYFADRESILAALVADGFDELTQRLREANDLAQCSGVRAALVASANAYVGFALSRAGVFRIMFRPDVCNPSRFPAVQQAGTLAHAQLERLTEIVYGKTAAAALATLLWAHVHGLACLLVDGPLASNFPTEELRARHLHEVGQQFADLIERARIA
jgi:AcrR family transcriptional regulator